MTAYLDFDVDAYRREFVDQKVMSLLGGGNEGRYSELRALLDRVTEAAALGAVADGLRHTDPPEGNLGRNGFRDRLIEASIPIEGLRWAMTPPEGDTQGDVWSHRGSDGVIENVKAKRIPAFQRLEIEAVVGRYIAGKVKSAAADRVLVDVLVAMEFFQYADSVLNAPHVPVLAPSILRRRPLLDWFLGRLFSAFAGLVGFGLFWLSSKLFFPEQWLWIVGVILVVLFVIEAVWSVAVLPRVWLAVRAAQKQIRGILSQMSDVYFVLESNGPISARHVTELVKKSAEAGVVWPAPLYVLLEDITARGGRF